MILYMSKNTFKSKANSSFKPIVIKIDMNIGEYEQARVFFSDREIRAYLRYRGIDGLAQEVKIALSHAQAEAARL